MPIMQALRGARGLPELSRHEDGRHKPAAPADMVDGHGVPAMTYSPRRPLGTVAVQVGGYPGHLKTAIIFQNIRISLVNLVYHIYSVFREGDFPQKYICGTWGVPHIPFSRNQSSVFRHICGTGGLFHA